jgi:hemerythrin
MMLLINELHEGLMTGQFKPALDRIFEKLIRCTRTHFAHEEQLFAETCFPGAKAHKQEHAEMIDQARTLQASFIRADQIATDLEVMDRLKEWLFGHILGSDREYVPHLLTQEVDPLLAAWASPERLPQDAAALNAGVRPA